MKDIYKNTLLFSLVLLIMLLCLEGGVRLFTDPVSRANFTPIPRSLTMNPDFPGVPYMFRPNATGEQHFGSNPDGYFDGDGILTYKINSLGFRGREISQDKPPGTIRVAIIGDSFTFGSGVRNEHSLPSALEKELISANPGLNIEVLNLGVGGYNTAHEVSLLENFGLKFDPDIVVICFFLNDTNAGGTARAFGKITSKDNLPTWRKYSRMADLLVSGIEMRHAAQKLVEDYKDSYRNKSPGWIKSQRALREAANLSQQKGFKLIMAIYPILWNLSDNYPFSEIHQTITAYSNSIDIPVFDLLTAFKGYDGKELWAHPNNQHPNPEAHQVAAHALSAYLMQEYSSLFSRHDASGNAKDYSYNQP